MRAILHRIGGFLWYAALISHVDFCLGCKRGLDVVSMWHKVVVRRPYLDAGLGASSPEELLRYGSAFRQRARPPGQVRSALLPRGFTRAVLCWIRELVPRTERTRE